MIASTIASITNGEKLTVLDPNSDLERATEQVLTAEARAFLNSLHQQFSPYIVKLRADRVARQKDIDNGILPDFLESTTAVRNGQWQVASAPADLNDRRVEITGPAERKMMINALNSGAKVFMADLEDSLSPTWANVVCGQLNLIEAVAGTLSFESGEKSYALKERSQLATLVVRPRGWHLQEANFLVDGEPMAASLFDFGLYFFHNAKTLLALQSAPYFYLPKLESHLEARLWNDVFNFAQDALAIPRGTIRATVLIETILAAFEMEEILFELKEHMAGLNAGRWDYIFSLIKKCSKHSQFTLPDRVQVTMAVPFMRAYAELLVKTCHKRGAHAIGGMAAFIPSRKDSKVNEIAFAKVREDKEREAGFGFDGTWVAHPDLVAVAKEIFDAKLGSNANQKNVLREEVRVTATQLLNTKIDAGVTIAGVSGNVDVALQYIESWLRGVGAAAIHNLMEDAATAEIARAQIWQWIHSGTKTASGEIVTTDLYKKLRDTMLAQYPNIEGNRFAEAAEILDQLVLSEEFIEFLTIPAYTHLQRG